VVEVEALRQLNAVEEEEDPWPHPLEQVVQQ
jgi:hypothetical protein